MTEYLVGTGLALLGLAAGLIGWLWLKAELADARAERDSWKVRAQTKDKELAIAQGEIVTSEAARRDEAARWTRALERERAEYARLEEAHRALVDAVKDNPAAVAAARAGERERPGLQPLPQAGGAASSGATRHGPDLQPKTGGSDRDPFRRK